MTLEEYKAARERSGISVLDNWCRVVGISEDTHKSINSGRLAVSETVANRIASYFSEVETRAIELRDQLSKALSIAFDSGDLKLDLTTFDIVFTPPGNKEIKVKHCGVDTMNGWGVYNISFGHGKEPLVLLHARAPRWQRKPNSFHWYMWRGPFSGHQSYWNEISADLLAECLRQ